VKGSTLQTVPSLTEPRTRKNIATTKSYYYADPNSKNNNSSISNSSSSSSSSSSSNNRLLLCELRSSTMEDTENDVIVDVDVDVDVDVPPPVRTKLPMKNITPNRKIFVNDGLFSWMQPFLDMFGFVEGNTVYYGPGVAVDESNFPSLQEQFARRNEASENMMNIGMEERERRREGGEIAYKATIAYALFSSLLLDDGSLSGHFVRFAIALPLFFAIGYTKSADSGL